MSIQASSIKLTAMNKLAISLRLMIITLALFNLGFSLAANSSPFDTNSNQARQASVNHASNSDYPSGGTLYVTNQYKEKFSALSLTTNVEMNISGLMARVKVTQAFKNNHDQWMEGKYQFPLPDKAAVDQLKIKIGERLIIGEIKEKHEAKKIYEKAKLAGKKASLVEQQRPNLFTNSVANIGPYETIIVTIEYQQDIKYNREDGFSIRFPMTITPRYQSYRPKNILTEEFNKINPAFSKGYNFSSHKNIANYIPNAQEQDDIEFVKNHNNVTLSIHLNSGIGLQSVSSPSHKIYHQQKTEREYEISFQQQSVKADRDFILQWQPIQSSRPRAAIFTERKAGENYLSMMIMPPSLNNDENSISIEEADIEEISRETIFVIDTSGSMSGESMKQAKNALLFGLSTLSPTDRFNVIQFNSESEKLFEQSREANLSNLQEASYYVASLNADGGTEMFSALDMSLDSIEQHQQLRQVIFLTDGAVSNEAELFKLIARKLGDSRLYTVGIGSAPNAFFMKKAARFGRGKFIFIANIKESQSKIQKLFNDISKPQLTHIDINWPSGVTNDTWPNKIPDLYNGQPLWLKSKISRLEGNVQITGRLGDTLWQSSISLDNSQQQEGIAALWAREKIASIMNQAFHGQVDDQQKQQIIDTALEHHLVSRFTSLIAVDKTPTRVTEQLQQAIIRNSKPKGYKSPLQSQPLQFAATGLDLDLLLSHSLLIFLLSSLSLFLYRKFL